MIERSITLTADVHTRLGVIDVLALKRRLGALVDDDSLFFGCEFVHCLYGTAKQLI